jgi:hypothetical protein
VIRALMEDENSRIETFLLLQTSAIGKANLFLSGNKFSRYDYQSFRSLSAILGLEDSAI